MTAKHTTSKQFLAAPEQTAYCIPFDDGANYRCECCGTKMPARKALWLKFPSLSGEATFEVNCTDCVEPEWLANATDYGQHLANWD